MSEPLLSKRLLSLPISATRKLVPYEKKALATGATMYHLNIGDPDIAAPQVMIDVLKQWNQNPIAYAPSAGTETFLAAVADYYQKWGYQVTSADIVATVGGSEAFSMAMFAVAETGEEIIVFEPFYSNYAAVAHINGIKLIPVATTLSNGFHVPSRGAIEAAITPKTRAILYSNPANPTGTVYTKTEIELLVSIAKKHTLFLIADEVYREFVFVARPHVSLFDYFSEIPDLAIVVDSLSKRYSLCGARLGTLATHNQSLLAGVKRIAASRLSAGLIDQQIGAALTRVPAAYIKNIHTEYKHRRDVLYERLKNIDGVLVTKPEGAFYVMAQLPVDDADEFCQWLLEIFRDHNETVMLAPGPGFYQTPGKGKQEVRIAYVLAEKKLLKATQILTKALAVFSKLGKKRF